MTSFSKSAAYLLCFILILSIPIMNSCSGSDPEPENETPPPNSQPDDPTDPAPEDPPAEEDPGPNFDWSSEVDVNGLIQELHSRVSERLADQAELYMYSEVTTDAAIVPTRGTDWDDNGRWRVVHTHEWTPDNQDIQNIWNTWNANILITRQIIHPNNNTPANILAQARFYRALSMFIILDNFRQLVFADLDFPANEDAVALTVDEMIEIITFDLEKAIQDLPIVFAGTSPDHALPHRAMAKFLLAKVLLNAHVYRQSSSPNSADMDRVIALVDEIALEGYGLEVGYFDIFREGPDIETIWYLPESVGSRIFNQLHFNSTTVGGGGWNGFSTLAEYYDLFEGDSDNNRVAIDLTPLDGQEERRGGVPPTGLPFTGREGTADEGGFEAGSNVGFGFLIGQQFDMDGTPLQDRPGNPLSFERDFTNSGGASSIIDNSEVTGIRVTKYNPRFNAFAEHMIYFRYSDAHLMKAEAILRNGGDATQLINELRITRGTNPLGSVSEQDILDERGRELFLEGWRRNDLIRFGKFLDEWELKSPGEIGNTTRLLFPIPPPILMAQPLLEQNPGY